MSRHAYWLVSPEAIQEVRRRHAGNIGVQQLEEGIIEDGNMYLRGGHLRHMLTLNYLVKDVVLHDLIQVIATHPDFERLTSK